MSYVVLHIYNNNLQSNRLKVNVCTCTYEKDVDNKDQFWNICVSHMIEKGSSQQEHIAAACLFLPLG